jgi:hypothetical protein
MCVFCLYMCWMRTTDWMNEWVNEYKIRSRRWMNLRDVEGEK